MANVVEHIKDENKEKRDARQKKESIAIDMNPMVDLAFLLLTFFMLTTTFTQPQAMEIVMPVKPKPGEIEKEQPIKESKTLTIILTANNRIYWFRGITDPEVKTTNYSATGVRKVLLDNNAQTNGLVVLIKPDEYSNYKNLVDILDEMTLSGISRYAVVDISDADKKLIEKVQ